jgi:hyperosmotically inducible protein
MKMNPIVRVVVAVLGAISVLAAAGCASSAPAKHQSTGEYLDDSVITTKVKAAIFNEHNLKSTEINVETYAGVVQLSGFVSSADAQNRAVLIAGRVDGVKSVTNDMHLK